YVAIAAQAWVVVPLIPEVPVQHAATASPTRFAPGERRELISLGIVLGMATGASLALGAYVTTSAVERGVSEAAAGLLLAAASVTGIISRFTAGFAADRLRIDPFMIIAAMMAAGSMGYAAMATGALPVFVISVALAFAGGW